jgi:hypothetical protein
MLLEDLRHELASLRARHLLDHEPGRASRCRSRSFPPADRRDSSNSRNAPKPDSNARVVSWQRAHPGRCLFDGGALPQQIARRRGGQYGVDNALHREDGEKGVWAWSGCEGRAHSSLARRTRDLLLGPVWSMTAAPFGGRGL